MALRLTKFQKRLCNVLQEDLPICWEPFDDLAKYLGTDEKTLLKQIAQLKKMGVVRRFRALINYRALGMISTLVAAHVPADNLQAVTEAVRSRIRPIYMSSITTVCAMMPLVLSPGAGSEFYRGLGSVVVGGILVSTIFTIFLIPSLLSLTLDTVAALKRVFQRS